MAVLIRSNTSPCKYLLKNKLNLVHKNRLQKAAAIKKYSLAWNQLHASIMVAREDIRGYLNKKNALAEEFALRSFRKYKIRLGTELIMVVVDFLRNLHHETKAINTIAYKIASNIVTGPLLIEDLSDDIRLLEFDLLKVMALKIYLPSDTDIWERKFYNLSALFGSSGLFVFSSEEKSKLEIRSDEISFNLFFNDADLDETLKNVCKLCHVPLS